MKKLKFLLLSILIIICVNVVMAVEVLTERPLTECTMINEDVQRITHNDVLPDYPITNTDKTVLSDYLKRKIKPNGELDSLVTKFPSASTTDRYVFKGSFTSTNDNLIIAVLSDDGVTVTIDGQDTPKFDCFDHGQALPDLDNSLKVVDGSWKSGETHSIEIKYSNTCYLSANGDIDGLTVFFCGGATISDSDLVNLIFNDKNPVYSFTGNQRLVKATVTVTNTGNVVGTAKVTGPGLNTPLEITMPVSNTLKYTKEIDITLPAGVSNNEYVVEVERLVNQISKKTTSKDIATVFKIEITGSDKTRFIPLSDDPLINSITFNYSITPLVGDYSISQLLMKVWDTNNLLVFNKDKVGDDTLLLPGNHQIVYYGEDNQTDDDFINPDNDTHSLKLFGYGYSESESFASNSYEFWADPDIKSVYIVNGIGTNIPSNTNLQVLDFDDVVNEYVVIKARYRKTDNYSYYCGYLDDNGMPSKVKIDNIIYDVKKWNPNIKGWSSIQFDWREVFPMTDHVYVYSVDVHPTYMEKIISSTTTDWKRSFSCQSLTNVTRIKVAIHYRWINNGNYLNELSTPGRSSIDDNGILSSVRRLVFKMPWSSNNISNKNFLQMVGTNHGCATILGGNDYQADNWIGMDCADLPISGWRKTDSGKNEKYSYAQGLYLKAVDGTYTLIHKDVPGNNIDKTNMESGDILLIKFHGTTEYEHTVIYRGGGTSNIVSTDDQEFSAHFVEEKYIDAKKCSASYLHFNDTVTVFRLK